MVQTRQNSSNDLPQEQFVVEEQYNGQPVHQYQYEEASHESERLLLDPSNFISLKGAGNLPTTSSFNYAQLLIHFKTFFTSVFLPQGYPYTVTSDYLAYQIWDTAQAFASSLTGALATAAVLKGVGVGSQSATVLAASITWLLKDGTGMMGRIVFAWAKGTRLDSECKKWRLIADGLNDIAFSIDLLAPHFSIALFAPCACLSSFFRSIVGVAGGATRTAIVRHQARRENLADVAAKDGSQETLVNVLSLLVSLVFLPIVDEKPVAVWTLFVLFTLAHLYCNYKAVKTLQLDTLNQARFQLCIRDFVNHGKVQSIVECNAVEPLWSSSYRCFGCELGKLPSESSTCHYYQQAKWVCVYDEMSQKGWIAWHVDAQKTDFFSAIFQLEYFGVAKSWPSLEDEDQFKNLLVAESWQLHSHQLNVDEWRYKVVQIQNSKSKNV
uniref:RUS family member 1 n=1 Tax=Ditylenchus dipsaci TaxID=166011 RepID=A0A915D9D7_9BILA